MFLGTFISLVDSYGRIRLEMLGELDLQEGWPPDFGIYFENLQVSKKFKNTK